MKSQRQMITSSLLVGALAALVWVGTAPMRSHAEPSYEDLDLFTNVLDHIRKQYVEEVDDRALIEGAVRGMLQTLDPHSSYLSPELFKDMQQSTRGEFEGLGIEISKRDGFVTVVAPIEGTPASKAGLQARDLIVAVCPDATDDSCQSTQDMPLEKAVTLMRGPRGTEILIRVSRDGWDTPRPFRIRRDSIKVASVRSYPIDDDLLYVQLTQFTENAASEVSAKLDEERARTGKQIGGLVFDLRNNPGGLLDQAVRVADLFLDEGLIVSSEGRNGTGRSEWRAKPEGTEPNYPIVILVNGGSASASEIVAGALQDKKRAIVLGTETFGKGSVQTIIPLRSDDMAGLRLTTQLYYLPSGRSIQKSRIQPDIEVQQFTEQELEARNAAKSARSRSFGEEDLEGSLGDGDRTGARPAKDEAAAPAAAEEPLTREEQFARQLEIDRQLIQAISMLKSYNVFSKLDSGATPGSE